MALSSLSLANGRLERTDVTLLFSSSEDNLKQLSWPILTNEASLSASKKYVASKAKGLSSRLGQTKERPKECLCSNRPEMSRTAREGPEFGLLWTKVCGVFTPKRPGQKIVEAG